jgi:sugar lactone lactonase YvrE
MGFSDDGGPAGQAQLSDPFGIVRRPDGVLYICDTGNHRIRQVAADGTISTVAGNGIRGYSGDGGPALQAELNEPYEVRFDSAGDLYFVERLNHLVRRVAMKSGIISTVAGTGSAGFSGDGGKAREAQLNEPHSIGFDRAGDLYICDIKNHRVRKVAMATGVISTFAGTGERKGTLDGAPIAGTSLNGPRALDFSPDGQMWLALREGNALYRIDLAEQRIHHVAGTGKAGASGNGGPAREATLSGPKGVSVGPDGNIYMADTESHTIRMVDIKTGQIELIAGTGHKGDGPDGDPLQCALSRPHGVFVDADGTVYIGDSEAHRVRAVKR